ncbi:hypothetical protein F511_01310 [Dorcoceras hygrometricum]|uniref:Aminotransferase class I/classII domain-containing protein n=1 Tax=Dorcoceras hygrometricum TaxID=472368 RepID=A0A2Z7D4G4_9LAMI|nr:hypothetical protein F511_01310 [Dorcoceras hygrometricum]
MLSKKATCKSHGQDSSYFLGWQEYEKNPFDPIRNPSGIIQMGLAENQLSFDLLESWIARNQEISGFKKMGGSVFRELALFQDYHGLPAFKKELVEYMSEIRQKQVKFDPDKVVLTAGATSANETLMFCLAEPGEAFLIPTPYYPGFDRDLKWRTGVEIIPVHCHSSNNFRITDSSLKEAYTQAQNLELNVKGIFITNPSNPLGTTLTLNELNLLIDFAINENIHIVSDEIYTGTVFDSPRFISIIEALKMRKLNPKRASIWSRVHIVCSLSKDLGLPGFRIGMIYSNNDTLIAAATKMSSFGLISSQSQFLLSKILGDKKFVRNYVKENGRRLKKRQKILVSGLREVGIPCLKSNSGLFCWVDMRKLLDSETFEAEMDLWRKIIRDFLLNVSPGSSCHCMEPGWFRVSQYSETEMDVSSLLTSAAINTAVCVALFSLYSVLRKQPSLLSVYFGQRLSQVRSKRHDPFCFERLVPSASWIVKAWEASEDELFAIGGVDAVVFLRAVVFSVRILTVAAIVCLFLVLPLNYNFGIEIEHKQFPDEPLNVFTIGNVKEGSRWLWAHCLALYIITCCACILLYFEYKNITRMRLAYINSSLSHPSHFAVLVRAIPWSREEAYSDTLTKFFTNYYSSSYLLHQMIYQSGTVQKLMSDAEKMYKILRTTHLEQTCGSKFMRCGFCGGTSAASFKILSIEPEISRGRSSFDGSDTRKKECGAALVFFRTRYAALVASEVLQAPSPMSWVTDSAPEPRDVYWSNLCVPYRLLWIRKIAVLVASILFVIFFLIPVVFTQSLVHFEKLKKIFPFLRDIGRRKFVEQVITGYLPSLIFMIFLYFVPPLMIVFSTLEGSISRSSRKRSSCIKVTYFVIWNVFFANILTETAIDHYQNSIMKLGDAKNIPNLLAKAVPSTATFFMTYVLTSGWASLSIELIQPFPLVCNLFYRFILQNKDETTYGTYTFPYHTEVPRVLLFGLLDTERICNEISDRGAVLACGAQHNNILVGANPNNSTGSFRDQRIVNCFKLYHSADCLHATLQRVLQAKVSPAFQKTPAKIIIEMDRQDEQCGRLEEIHQKLQSAYNQFTPISHGLPKTVEQTVMHWDWIVVR